MTPQYSATIFEHFRHPRNYGALLAPEVAYEAVNALWRPHPDGAERQCGSDDHWGAVSWG